MVEVAMKEKNMQLDVPTSENVKFSSCSKSKISVQKAIPPPVMFAARILLSVLHVCTVPLSAFQFACFSTICALCVFFVLNSPSRTQRVLNMFGVLFPFSTLVFVPQSVCVFLALFTCVVFPFKCFINVRAASHVVNVLLNVSRVFSLLCLEFMFSSCVIFRRVLFSYNRSRDSRL